MFWAGPRASSRNFASDQYIHARLADSSGNGPPQGVPGSTRHQGSAGNGCSRASRRRGPPAPQAPLEASPSAALRRTRSSTARSRGFVTKTPFDPPLTAAEGARRGAAATVPDACASRTAAAYPAGSSAPGSGAVCPPSGTLVVG